MVDQNYNNIVILCYPPGSGGNFLINCLSLNDSCVLRDALLAEKQITSGFTVAEKIEYFHTHLELAKKSKQWSDLGLGCAQLFGVNSDSYLKEYPEIIQRKFNYVIKYLIAQQKYFFIIAHSIQHLDAYYKFWPNAKTIFLTDYREFVKDRGYNKNNHYNLVKLKAYWDKVKGPSWPTDPPTTDLEFYQLPDNIQHELTDQFHGEIFKWTTPKRTEQDMHDFAVAQRLELLGNRATSWSVKNNYNGNEEDFWHNLIQCASWLNVTIDASKEDVIGYYRHWRSVLEQIKRSVHTAN